MYIIQFELKGLPPNNNARMNWRVKAKHNKKWTEAAIMAARQCDCPPEPLKTAKLTLTRFSSVEPDFDNLVTSFKPVIDGLKRAGVIEDDKRANVGQPAYFWEKAKPGQGKIRIRVEGEL